MSAAYNSNTGNANISMSTTMESSEAKIQSLLTTIKETELPLNQMGLPEYYGTIERAYRSIAAIATAAADSSKKQAMNFEGNLYGYNSAGGGYRRRHRSTRNKRRKSHRRN